MKVIVICTGNSCRSQMAEGLIKNKYPNFEVSSAGSHPEESVNPYAVKVMQDIGIDISQNVPKNVNKFVDDEFDYVFTVCDSAVEICPVFNNAKNKVHKSFVDPKRDSYDSEEHAIEIYTETRNLIEEWINEYEDIWS